MSMGPSGEKLGSIIPLSVQIPDVGAVTNWGTVEAICVIPFNCEITAIEAAGNVSGTVSMEVYDESLATPATILSSAIGLSADYTGYAGSIASAPKQLAKGTVLSFRIKTATGACTDGTATLILKKLDMTYGS